MIEEFYKKTNELENAHEKLSFCSIALIIFNIALVISSGRNVLFCVFLIAWLVTMVTWFIFLIKCIKCMIELNKMKRE